MVSQEKVIELLKEEGEYHPHRTFYVFGDPPGK